MPKEMNTPNIDELLEAVEVKSDTVALRLYVLAAKPEIRALQARVTRYESALKWYGDKENWIENQMDKPNNFIIRFRSNITKDQGARAREALKDL